MLNCGTCVLFKDGYCHKPDDMDCLDAVAATKELAGMLLDEDE